MRRAVVLGWVVLPMGCGASIAREALARGVHRVPLDLPEGRPLRPTAEAARSTRGHH